MNAINYENLNEAKRKLPHTYIGLDKDGWNKWYLVIVQNEWEIFRSKRKFDDLVQAQRFAERLRDLMNDRRFCPTIVLPEYDNDSV